MTTKLIITETSRTGVAEDAIGRVWFSTAALVRAAQSLMAREHSHGCEAGCPFTRADDVIAAVVGELLSQARQEVTNADR